MKKSSFFAVILAVFMLSFLIPAFAAVAVSDTINNDPNQSPTFNNNPVITGNTATGNSVGPITNSQGQHQGQVQSQSMINGQTISPSQSVSIQGSVVDPGLGRDFVPVNPQIPIGVIKQDSKGPEWDLLKEIGEYPERVSKIDIQNLYHGEKKREIRIPSGPLFPVDECRFYLTKPAGLKSAGLIRVEVTKTSWDAIASAQKAAMYYGYGSIALINCGVRTNGSSSVIGIGLAYTQSALEGARMDTARTGGGGTGFAYSWGGSNLTYVMSFSVLR